MIDFNYRHDRKYLWQIMDNRGKLGYTNHMETKNTNPRTIPQIVLDAVAKDYPQGAKITARQHTVFMVESGFHTVSYYIVNADRSEIIDIQVD